MYPFVVKETSLSCRFLAAQETAERLLETFTNSLCYVPLGELSNCLALARLDENTRWPIIER